MGLAGKKLFLDANAGLPPSSLVRQRLGEWLREGDSFSWANPSSLHGPGRDVRRALSEAREAVAKSLGVQSVDQLVATSSGSEANQTVIRAMLEAHPAGGRWVTTSVEHDSLRQLIPWVRQKGHEVIEVPVNTQGCLDLEVLEQALEGATLLSLVWVNNETGVIQPLDEILPRAHQKGVPVHLDAAQAWGKLPFRLSDLGVQWATFSAPKIGGLAGVGFLWRASHWRPFQTQKKGSLPWQSLILGKQERGRRGGTENVIGLLAAGFAAQQSSQKDWEGAWKKATWHRDYLEQRLQTLFPTCRIAGQGAPRICQTVTVCFPEIEGESLVFALDVEGYAVSAGSACASGVSEPSHVLQAMGFSRKEALSALRISFPIEAPESSEDFQDSLEEFLQTLQKLVHRIKNLSSSHFSSEKVLESRRK